LSPGQQVKGLIGVLTKDVRLYYDLMRFLKQKKLGFRMLAFDEPVPLDIGVILTSKDELGSIEFKPKLAVSDMELAVRKARLALLGISQAETVIVGVDPGPEPGIAVLCSGQIIETTKAHSPEQAAEIIIRILGDYAFGSSILNMGDGAPVWRDRLLALIFKQFDHVELIDEKNTSTRSHDTHVDAAVAIARHRSHKR
jgi:hypothetical protein